MGAPDATLVDQHLDPAVDEAGARGGGDPVLALAQLEEPFLDEPGVDPAVERGGQRAVLRREGEEAGPVEPRLVEEGQEEVVVVLGLPRVADDERRAEGRLGLPGPDRLDPAEEPVAVAPAAHAP